MRSRRITAMALSTLVAAGGLAAAYGGAARASEPGSDGLLAATGGNPSFVFGNPDGTGQHVLANGGGDANQIAWSSDGSRFVASSGYGLAIHDADGTNQTALRGVGWSGSPTWFAGNTEVVYENTGPAGAHGDQLYVAPVADTGRNPTPLFGVADTGFCDAEPRAHGNQIVFFRSVCGTGLGDDPRNGVWIYDAATGAAHEVVSDAESGDISPDGTKLAFVKPVNNVGQLYVSAIDGSGAARLGTSGPGQYGEYQPVWSPSGTSIAFTVEDIANTVTGEDVDVIDVATQVRRTWLTLTHGNPAWQPVNPSAPSAHPGPAPTATLQSSVGDVDPGTGGDKVTLNATGSTGDAVSYAFDFGDGSQPSVSATPTITKPEREGTYGVKVIVTDRWGRSATSTQWVTVGDGYHPVAPQRLLDTRSGLGAPQGRTTSVTLQLPDSILRANTRVTAAVLNVTVTDTASAGNVKVYPHGLGGAAPTTSNLNFVAGQTVANLVTVPVIDGKVQMDVAGAPLSLVADVAGYYTAGASGSGFAPINPDRLLDTRDGTGGVGRTIPGYGQVSLPVPDSVPADATAVVLNVTAVNTTNAGDLTVYPDDPGQPRPLASNLNFGTGAVVPNLVIVPVSADRKIDFYVHSPGPADVLADIEGSFSPSATSRFVPWTPTRLLDTRTGDAGGALASGSQIQVALGERLQIPNLALSAGLYNVTVTEPQGPGHITVYPDGMVPVPVVSNLNYTAGQTVPNAVLAPMTDGRDDFYNLGARTQLIVDFFGYFALPVENFPPTTGGAENAVVSHGAF